MLLEFLDEAGADAVETGEETAPDVFVAPENVAGLGIDDAEVGVAGWGSLGIIGNLVLRHAARCIDGTGLTVCEKDVAALIGIGGKKEDEIGLGAVVHDSEFAPFFQPRGRFGTYSVGAGLVKEQDGFGSNDARRMGELLLGRNAGSDC